MSASVFVITRHDMLPGYFAHHEIERVDVVAAFTDRPDAEAWIVAAQAWVAERRANGTDSSERAPFDPGIEDWLDEDPDYRAKEVPFGPNPGGEVRVDRARAPDD